MIETPLGRALPLICYEVIFPGHGRGLERPDYLLQITNDAWFGTVSGPYQHLDQARFRAVEQGLPLVRVANTGVSAVIDARGEIVASLALGEAAFLDVALPKGEAATLYARIGDIPIGVFPFGNAQRANCRGAAQRDCQGVLNTLTRVHCHNGFLT